MKKLLFAAYDMNIGGIETSLLTLLNYLADKQYDITLVLERKQGKFLNDLNSNINVIEYNPSENRIFFIRKILNLFKRFAFILKHKNKYDFSASFATYSCVGSFIARNASTNNALWCHADYLELFKNDKEKVKEFFEKLHCREFKNIIFVANEASKTFIQVYPELKQKVVFCNNLIDYKKILELSKEKITEVKNTYTFVNIGRHDELQKKLTRIIEASKMLKKDNLNFKVLFIGEGKDTKLYKQLVEKYNLQEKIEFLGAKKNPYPYMKLADTVLLTSDYEGYPVVFIEALILNKPIITTDVSDAMQDINNKYGKVIKKDENELYLAMKEFIQNGYEIEEKFDPEKYNKEITRKLKNIIN